ncbi:MAG TPA: DNA ligase, partial [Candidatus Nanoarchaeia archaeon]|nr:DNA ligase [Candidatus Nanoarchaeia archaeon]
MDYSELARVYENLGKTTKRLEKRDILAELFRNAGKDLKDVVYLAQGKVFPLWDERKIGFSSRLMIKALNQATGITGNEIEKLLNKYGDLGKVAEDLVARKKQHTLMSSTLTVDKIFSNIRKLATMEGQGTVNRKTQLVSELITNATKDEVRYIVGLVLEELRVGVSDGIVRDALAQAFNVDANEIEVAHDTIGDYGEVAIMARDGKLHELKLEAGRAMKVMLAILVKDVKEGLETVGKPAEIEQKYDGFRAELHKKKGKISLFTRRMEEVTHQFPEVVEYVKENVKGDDFILDSEIVGYEKKTGNYLPFQK